MAREIIVTCPFCHGLLRVDTKTKKLLGTLSKEEAALSKDARFDKTLERVKETRREGDKRLEEAERLREEKRRRALEMFEKAKGEAEEKDDPEKPPSIFGD